MKKSALLAAATATLALAACASETETDTTATTTTETVPADPATAGPAAATGTVVEVAQGNPDFSTLVSAVTAADLGGTLSGAGPFTVFAPTNAAFEKVPAATRTELMSPAGKEQLTGILTYHVVPGRTDAAALTAAIRDAGAAGYRLTTVNGAQLTATLDGDRVVLTDAAGGRSTVTTTDVAASNGIIHAIDTVLMPAA